MKERESRQHPLDNHNTLLALFIAFGLTGTGIATAGMLSKSVIARGESVEMGSAAKPIKP